jgi:hypothetical protein
MNRYVQGFCPDLLQSAHYRATRRGDELILYDIFSSEMLEAEIVLTLQVLE